MGTGIGQHLRRSNMAAREEISDEIANMLQEISRKLNGFLRNDEIEYIVFQLDRIETILSLCMQTMEVNNVLSKISEAKYLLLSLCSNFLDKEVTGDTVQALAKHLAETVVDHNTILPMNSWSIL